MTPSRSEVRAVLFDSGGTLARPIDNDWWPKPTFKDVIADFGFAVPDSARVRTALETGMPHLSTHWQAATLAEEHAAYIGFYEIVLSALFGDAPPRLVTDLAHAAIYVQDQRPYDDTVPTLNRLASAGFGLGVVSNAGPSLELRHQDMGLRDFFDPFVVSAVVGHEKPGRRIFEIALEDLALTPMEVVFVDDVARNVEAACELGMRGFVIDRAHRTRDHAQPGEPTLISTLAQVGDILGIDGGGGSGSGGRRNNKAWSE